MVCHAADDAHHTCAAYHTHLRSHSVLLSYVDSEVIVLPVYAVGDHFGRYQVQAFSHLGLFLFGEGWCVPQAVQLASHDAHVVLEHHVLPGQVFVLLGKVYVRQYFLFPFHHTGNSGVGLGKPYAALVCVETEK